MKSVSIVRMNTSSHGTRGLLLVNNRFFAYTMEPPWRDNESNLSCIPAGTYLCVWHFSPRYGWVYMVTDVEGRSYILFHPGNYGGDTTKGYKTHTNGCVLLGSRRGWLSGQRAVLASRVAVRRFFSLMNRETFQLTVIGDAYVGSD